MLIEARDMILKGISDLNLEGQKLQFDKFRKI